MKFLDRTKIGENVVVIVIEVMDKVEVILEGVVFKVGPVVTLEELIIEIEVERIRDLGDSLEKLGQNQALDLDQIQELVQIRTEFGVLNVGNMIILLMNVQI